MKQGDRLAAEREFGRPRQFIELVREEPVLRELASQATAKAKRRRRQDKLAALKLGMDVVIALALLLAAAAVMHGLGVVA